MKQPLDKHEQKALDNIEKYGCHVISVMEGDGQPAFTYSVGIEKMQNKPELIIVGLKSQLAHSMVNNYNDRITQGENIEPGRFYQDFLGGFDVCFIEVSKKYYREYFGWDLWLYGGTDFKVLQLIWPTTAGIWPWDEDKSEYYQWAQPILNDIGKLENKI